MSTWWLWILGALVCGIVEVMSVSFVFLMFAIGALAAGIAGACGADLMVQVIVFIVVSIALLVILRPFLKGRIDRSSGYVPSNTDGLIGKTGYVTEAVSSSPVESGARAPRGRCCPSAPKFVLIASTVQPLS